MPKRRQYRTGSIHRHHAKDCPRTRCSCPWRGTVDAGYTRSGGRRRITVTAPTEAEAKRRLDAKVLEVKQGREVKGRTTVKAWMATWLKETARTVRPKTHVTDKGAAAYIVASIGHRRLTQLTPGDIRAVRDAITDDGRSSSTALRYHGTLMRALKAASEDGHDIPGRVLSMKPPKKAANDREAIPLEDSLALLSVVSTLPHGSRWVAALLQGMRQGECLGLTWGQVDLDAGALTISWQLQPLQYRIPRDRSSGFLVPDGYEARQLEGRMHLVRPKSAAGWRVVPLVRPMLDSLRHWREVGPQSPHGLVWPALDGSPADVVADRDEWDVIQETVGVRHPTRVDDDGKPRGYLVHEARHATGMLLLALRVDEAIRIQIMGHSSIASTRAYEHRDIELARQALERAAERLQLG